MAKWIILSVVLALWAQTGEAAKKSPRKFQSLGPTINIAAKAKQYLEGALSADLKNAKWTQQCGKPKVKDDHYKYICKFEFTAGDVGGAYAVFLSKRAELVAVMRGRGRKVGDRMDYTFGVHESSSMKPFTKKPGKERVAYEE